ncbi:MAG: hypothetical protein ABIN80_00005 [Dyadobacter sp.]|uniref:hypothetical protein n=1 Tax=Dyadobacter sp. TaxID=1914288 RepID=UPI003267E5FA
MNIDKYIKWLFDTCEKVEKENDGIIPDLYRKNAFLPNSEERAYLTIQVEKDVNMLIYGLEGTVNSSVLSELEVIEKEYKDIWKLDFRYKQYFIDGKPIELSEEDTYSSTIFEFRRAVGSIKFDSYLRDRSEELKAIPEGKQDKLVWLGQINELPDLILSLVSKGKIEAPMIGGYPNVNRLTKMILTAFKTKDGELSKESIYKGISPNTKKGKIAPSKKGKLAD